MATEVQVSQDTETYGLLDLLQGLDLNARQEQFVVAYCCGPHAFNGQRAYQSAYPNSSDTAARTNASLLLTRANVREGVRKLCASLNGNLEPIKLRLQRDAEVDASALLEECWTKDDDGRKVLDWSKAKACGLTRFIRKVTPTRQGDSIELLDPHRAAELVGKFAGAFVQRVRLEDGRDLASLSDEQLKALADGREVGA
jgi:hypothetical protein